MSHRVDYHYLDTEAQLFEMSKSCARHDVVTVDTEFARSHTYYPEVGLIQVYDGENCFIIDPIAIGSLAGLAPLLEDTSVRKVFHACSEDMEVFHYAIGALPSPVFDTQIAAAAVGVGFSISYQNLVGRYLDIEVPKEETRSDWLQRPLTQSQLDYAALDVIYLLEVYNKQIEQLERENKLGWVEEECSHLTHDIAIAIDPDECYLRVKSANRMDADQLNRLRSLCAWRERKARELNVPRNRVVDEKVLSQLSRSVPRDREDLKAGGMMPRQIRKFADDVLDTIAFADAMPKSEHPEPLEDPNAVNIANSRVKRLKQVVEQRAAVLNVAPEMLARRRHLEQLLRSGAESGDYELPEPLSGWRKDAIGDHLLKELATE